MKDNINVTALREFIKKLKEEDKKIKEKIAHAEGLLAAMATSRPSTGGRSTPAEGIDAEIKAVFKAENYREMKLDEIVNKVKERIGNIDYGKVRGRVTNTIRKRDLLERAEKYGYYALGAAYRVEVENVP